MGTDLSDEGQLDEFCDRLGHHFADPGLLTLALTHRSFCAEHPSNSPNERLEFLGDSVLGLVVTDHIYRNYPELPEGQLAKLRASVVNTATLAELGRRLRVGPLLRLGKGEDQSGGRDKESILADALEALFGAVYVDGGWDAAQSVILTLTAEAILEAAEQPGKKDYKTQLQELTARLALGTPVYQIDGSGPDHDKRFTAVTLIDGVPRGHGAGTSKKRAEQVAARSAYTAVLTSVAKEDGSNGQT
ncbi:MAG: ribonuclease III [Acidimicrobiia bacterium]|nr:ribonuclease III [Acidimicrobiia bacterium]MDH5291625.1 ribonuclease III [Acidimicrobiia bacterium]